MLQNPEKVRSTEVRGIIADCKYSVNSFENGFKNRFLVAYVMEGFLQFLYEISPTGV